MFFALTAAQLKHDAFRKYPTRRIRVPFTRFRVFRTQKENIDNISKVVYTNMASSFTRLNLGARRLS